jgi:hypothetical protein
MFGRLGVNPLAGHPVLFIGPPAEIDQFAALRTEGTVRIVLPFDWLSARRTFRHKAKVRRKKLKVKAGRERQLFGVPPSGGLVKKLDPPEGGTPNHSPTAN